jgi:hypothetical protein
LLRRFGSLRWCVPITALVLLIPVGVELLRSGLAAMAQGSIFAQLNAVALGVASAISTVTAIGGVLLRRGRAALDTLDRFQVTFDAAVATATQLHRDAVAALEKDVAAAQQSMAEAERRLRIAADHAAEAEQNYANDTARGRLNRFIRDKVVDGTYAKHLGIVASIRRDFGQLAEIMRDERLEKGMAEDLEKPRAQYQEKLKALIDAIRTSSLPRRSSSCSGRRRPRTFVTSVASSCTSTIWIDARPTRWPTCYRRSTCSCSSRSSWSWWRSMRAGSRGRWRSSFRTC